MQAQPTDLLVRLLGACETRARVVSANIANSNTPGYVRQVVRFEELLGKELANGGDPALVAPEIQPDLETPARPDGNNVSLDRETRLLAENALRFSVATSLARSQLHSIQSAIEDGKSA